MATPAIPSPSPYELLGISSAASPQAVKRAYRRQAYLHHPDRLAQQQVNDEHFKQVTAAYQILKDEQMRLLFDWLGTSKPTTPEELQVLMEQHIQQGLHTLWHKMLQRLPKVPVLHASAQQLLPAPMEYRIIDVPLTLAIAGGRLDVPWLQYCCCTNCKGIGLISTTQSPRCPTCQGRGRLTVKQMLQQRRRSCPHCFGIGRDQLTPCPPCQGIGTTCVESRQLLSLPALSLEGPFEVLSQRGHQREIDVPASNVQMLLRYQLPQGYWRQDKQLCREMTIPQALARQGGPCAVDWLERQLTITIPGGSTTGTILRLRHMGLPYQPQSRSSEATSASSDLPTKRGEGRLHLVLDSKDTHDPPMKKLS